MEEEGKPKWQIDLARVLLCWFAREAKALAGKVGPFYLIVKVDALLAANGKFWEWLLEGAAESFDDIERKAMFRRLKEAIAKTEPGKQIDLPTILGFDLREWFNPPIPPDEA